MYNLWGFKIMTKAERKEKEAAYAKMIFPGGEAQRESVMKLLRERIPQHDVQVLLYLYISVRQKMEEDGKSAEEALTLSMVPAIGKFTPEERQILCALLEEQTAAKVKREETGQGERNQGER